jgi:hypothetical protein
MSAGVHNSESNYAHQLYKHFDVEFRVLSYDIVELGSTISDDLLDRK